MFYGPGGVFHTLGPFVGHFSSQELNVMSGVSLKPSDAVAGGGAYDDIDVAILSCRFISWDYKGAIPAPILGLKVDYKTTTDGFEFDQVYSAGELSHFVPSADGRLAVPVGKLTGLVETSNAILFLTSIVNSGFPEDKIADDVSVFEGLVAHVNKLPQPKRGGLKAATPDQAGGKKDYLAVTKIHSYPWDAKQGPAASGSIGTVKTAQPKAAAAPKAAAVATSTVVVPVSGDLQSKAIETVMAILGAKGGSVARMALTQEAFKILKTDPARNEVVQLVYSEPFLKGAGVEGGVPWAFDGTTVSMG